MEKIIEQLKEKLATVRNQHKEVMNKIITLENEWDEFESNCTPDEYATQEEEDEFEREYTEFERRYDTLESAREYLEIKTQLISEAIEILEEVMKR